MRTDGCLFPTYPYQWQTRLLLRLRTTCSSLVVVIVVPCWNTIRQSDNPAKSAHGAQQGSGDCARGQRCGHGGVWGYVKSTPAICGAVHPGGRPLGATAKPDKSLVRPRCNGNTSYGDNHASTSLVFEVLSIEYMVPLELTYQI